MAVFGGETKTLIGRVFELVAWWPLMLGLTAFAGMSVVSEMGMDMPDWLTSAVQFYQGLRDHALHAAGVHPSPMIADIAIGGLAFVAMIIRRVLGFALTVIAVATAAGALWFVFRHIGH